MLGNGLSRDFVFSEPMTWASEIKTLTQSPGKLQPAWMTRGVYYRLVNATLLLCGVCSTWQGFLQTLMS